MTMAEIMPYFNISIHAPREGCDSVTLSALYCVLGFQSTHPVRGATE